MPVILNDLSFDMASDPGINVTSLLGGAGTGVLTLSDSGAAETISATVPGGYASLTLTDAVNATILGNGADGFTATFGADDTVSFNSNGGSGTVNALAANDFADVTGTTWSVNGFSGGGDTVNSSTGVSTIAVSGNGNAANYATGADSTPSNVVGLAGTSAVVTAGGENDLIETFNGSDTISVTNSANVLINGGAATVYAVAGNHGVNAFFQGGGSLDFINNGSGAATVSGDAQGGSGSTTAFGGAGGGLYVGGSAGNNSLLGGTGQSHLIASGTNNFLSVQGAGASYAAQNVMEAGSGGATMVGGVGSGFNEFHGGTGTDSMVSFGTGAQSFYVGASGSEKITGSTNGVNAYLFNQDNTGDSQVVITNFRVGTDHIYINANGGQSGVSIQGIGTYGGGAGGSEIFLSNSSIITLYGVSAASVEAATLAGGHTI